MCNMAPKTATVEQAKLEKALFDHIEWRSTGGLTRTFDFQVHNGGITYDNVPNLIGLDQNSDIIARLVRATRSRHTTSEVVAT